MYQWAATLTSSGQNLPFTLPLSVKKLSNGFQASAVFYSNQPTPVTILLLARLPSHWPSKHSGLQVFMEWGSLTEPAPSKPFDRKGWQQTMRCDLQCMVPPIISLNEWPTFGNAAYSLNTKRRISLIHYFQIHRQDVAILDGYRVLSDACHSESRS